MKLGTCMLFGNPQHQIQNFRLIGPVVWEIWPPKLWEFLQKRARLPTFEPSYLRNEWPNLLINLSEPFFDTTVGPCPNLARMCGYRRDWLSPKKLTNPTPEGFRGLFIDVCGMFVCGMSVAWFKPVVDRKLLERLMSPKSQVMFASAFSWIGDLFEFLGFIFFKLWRVGEFSLRFTAAVSAVDQRSISGRCVYKESGSFFFILK